MIHEELQKGVAAAVAALYQHAISPADIPIQVTREEYEGDLTVVVFPFTKVARQKPPEVGAAIGEYLATHVAAVASFSCVQGFLNLTLTNDYWHSFTASVAQSPAFGKQPANGRKVLVEYSSPNTNKPLHLGHVRNILLGWSVANVLEWAGNDIVRTQVINDRGIHICKSMLMWKLHANGATPESTHTKGDHFVGEYYVRFDREFQAEYAAWQLTDEAETLWKSHPKYTTDDETAARYRFFKDFYKNTYFNEISPLGIATKTMLLAWEANDPAVRQLWETMNSWVYAGFNETYKSIGVRFDHNYYESETYAFGKEMIEKGIAQKLFTRRDDGSVWIDLTDAKMDEKLVLRSDGTSVYITQDLGMANLRYEHYGMDGVVYVVGDEQNYHFQVLFEILKRLGEPYAERLYHLSYGMVNLPTGRMKTREGTVVDADDLMIEVAELAKTMSEELGLANDLPEPRRREIWRRVGLAALKYQLLKVSPTKSIVFNPEESVDFHGQTGPYIQYAYVRAQNVLEKAAQEGYDGIATATAYILQTPERDLASVLQQYPSVIESAARNLDPSELCTYAFEAAKQYNKFYHDCSILKAETDEAKRFRLALTRATNNVLASALTILGIDIPERM